MHRLFRTSEGKNLYKKVSGFNLSSKESLKDIFELLFLHIEKMAPLLKISEVKMISDIDFNLIEDLKNISVQKSLNRYFQLIGVNSTLISAKQYALATQMRNDGAAEEIVLSTTKLFFCPRDKEFKGVILEPLVVSDYKINQLLDQEQITVGDLVEHSTILVAYPALKNINVFINDIGDARGQYKTRTNSDGFKTQEIFLSTKLIQKNSNGYFDKDQFVTTLNHELQHCIQQIETYWSKGASVNISDEDFVDMIRCGIDVSKRKLFIHNPDFRNSFFKIEELQDVLANKYKCSKNDILGFNDGSDDLFHEYVSSVKAFEANEHYYEYSCLCKLQTEFEEDISSKRICLPEVKFHYYNKSVGEMNSRLTQELHDSKDMMTKYNVSIERYILSINSCAYNYGIQTGVPIAGLFKACEKEMGSLGFIDFYEDSKSVISFVKDRANSMTVVHELLGHYVFNNLLKASSLVDAPDELKKTMANFISSCSENSNEEFTHEKFSSSMEAFILFSGVLVDQFKSVSESIRKEISANEPDFLFCDRFVTEKEFDAIASYAF